RARGGRAGPLQGDQPFQASMHGVWGEKKGPRRSGAWNPEHSSLDLGRSASALTRLGATAGAPRAWLAETTRCRREGWAHQDSNLEQAGYEPAALTVELWARTILRRPSLEERAQLARARRMPQLAERLCLDLADALAGDGEALADFLERVLAAVADAEPHLDHLLLARGERLEHRLGLLLEVQVDHRFGRRHHLAILDEVAEMRIFLFADRRLERDRLLRDLEHLADLRHRNVHALGDLFRGRLAAELLHQRARGANQLVDRLDHVHRDADRPRLVGDRAGNRLPDPPRRIGRELVAAAVLELVHRLHQADVPFLDQVEELEAAVGVFLGDRDDQAEVGIDELLLGHLGLVLALEDHVERLLQLVGGLLQRVGKRLDLEFQLLDLTLDVLLVFLLDPSLLVLGVELPLEPVDFALHRFDALDRVLHLVDQAPLDRFGELDLADRVGDVDQRAHRLPAALAVLALVAAGGALRRL